MIMTQNNKTCSFVVVFEIIAKQPYKREQNKILEKIEKRWLLDFSMNRAEIPRLDDAFRNEMEHQTSNDTIKRLVWEHLWMCNCVKLPISIHRQETKTTRHPRCQMSHHSEVEVTRGPGDQTMMNALYTS